MAKRHEADLALVGRGGRRAVTVYEAMSPEAAKATEGTKVDLSMRDGTLFLHFQADTVPALRALVNSYLRWLFMIEEVINIVEKEST